MKVLVIEDSRLHQKVIRKILSISLPEADLICCNDAFGAYAALMGLPQIDLVIMDHNMPFAKGGDLVRKMRSTKRFGETPIVMLTADDGEAESFLKIGANAHFPKPFDPNAFKKKIQELGL